MEAYLSKELLRDARRPVEAESQPLPGVACGDHNFISADVHNTAPVWPNGPSLPPMQPHANSAHALHPQTLLTEVSAVNCKAQRQQPLLRRPDPQIVPQQRHIGCATHKHVAVSSKCFDDSICMS